MKILIILLATWYPLLVWADGCQQLQSTSEINKYLTSLKKTNPLMRDQISVLLQFNTCSTESCWNPEKRSARKKSMVQILKQNDRQKILIVKGEKSPQCYITRGDREFRCRSCDIISNRFCRSFNEDEDSSRVRGTNIDSADFRILDDGRYEAKCYTLSNSVKYVKVVLKRSDSISAYDKNIIFLDIKRNVPIVINYYSKGQLLKVYRFFPNHYIEIDKQWYSTYFRVRSTQGKEKNYRFETLGRVVKDNHQQPMLFPDPMTDPRMKPGNRRDPYQID